MDGHFSFVCMRVFTARIQGFRCAPPPACGLSPLTGLNGWAFFIRLYVGFHRPFTGVPLRSTACLCSVALDGAERMNEYQSLEIFLPQRKNFRIFLYFCIVVADFSEKSAITLRKF